MILPRRRLLVGAAGLAAVARKASGGDATVQLVQVIDLSGAGATVGDAWRSGVEIGVQELNARGGLLGRMVQTVTYDSQSNPAVARTMVQRALDGDAYVLLGPSSATAIRLTAPLVRQARIAQIVDNDAADLTMPGGALFRTGIGPNVALAKLALWARDTQRARRVALLWTNSETGRAGRDGFLHELVALGVDVAADVPVDSLRGDAVEEIGRIARAGADAVFVSAAEQECARLLVEARRRDLVAPLFGTANLVSQTVVDRAGPAAAGVRGHVDLPDDAPLPALAAFRRRYLERNKEPPDRHAIRGAVAVAMVAAVTARMGRVDPHAFADTLRGLTVTTAAEPGILADASWDATGEMDRTSWIAEVRDGRPVVVQALAPLRAA